ncbi:MAG: hypothetical protein WCI46_05005 [Verrucomicrobiota bacterium]
MINNRPHPLRSLFSPFRYRLLFTLLTIAPLPAALPKSPEIFVAVGRGTPPLSSTDGQVWQIASRFPPKKSLSNLSLHQVAFGLGRFIAVGSTGNQGIILTSRNGRQWSSLHPQKSQVSNIVFSGQRFIAIRSGALLYSTNGLLFSTGEKLPWLGTISSSAAAWGDGEAGGLCVFLGSIRLPDQDKIVHWRASTADGTTYTSQELNTAPARGIAYGSGHWVIVGPSSLLESSHDGQTWQLHPTRPDQDFQSIVWTGSRFLIGGATNLWSSTDGINWEEQITPAPPRLIWGREPQLGLAISPTNHLETTSDFLHWRRLPFPIGAEIHSVITSVPSAP